MHYCENEKFTMIIGKLFQLNQICKMNDIDRADTTYWRQKIFLNAVLNQQPVPQHINISVSILDAVVTNAACVLLGAQTT